MTKPSSLKKLRRHAFLKQGCRCYYCGLPMWEDNPEQFALCHSLQPKQTQLLRSTAEHLVAQQDGGANSSNNIVAACRFCNLHRHKGRPKNAPDPGSYKAMICRRMAQGKWHPANISHVHRR